MKKLTALLAALLVSGLASAPVNAEILTFQFGGVVNSTSNPSVADQFTGSFAYDTSVPSSAGNLGSSIYNALYAYSFDSGQFSTSVGFNSSNDLQITDSFTGSDQLLIRVYQLNSSYSSAITFLDYSGTAFTSTALPSTLSLSQFDSATIVLFGADGPIRGTITSLSQVKSAVPELSTWAMMMVGFAVVGAMMRYRRRQTAMVHA